MTGKAVWKGSLDFGDFHLPVKLHTAVREEHIRFHLLHRRDHTKLRQQMICAFEKKPVPAEEQVKGFEVEDGKYVIVDPAELEQANFKNSRVVEVHEFVRTAQIGPIFLDRVYYLEPDAGAQSYDALVMALKEMDVAGVCTWAMRKRQYLGALQTWGRMLRLTTLRYADEIISPGSFETEGVPLSEKELKIGSELIRQLTAPFQPRKFENEHEKKLQLLIDKKARGEKIAVLAARPLKPTSSNRLLQALEASLKKVA